MLPLDRPPAIRLTHSPHRSALLAGLRASCHHRDVSGTLFLVGTPIGNLGDVSSRAREVLGTVDVVAAEDTRRTGRLLRSLGIAATLVSLHDANEREREPRILATLRSGRSVAVVSDAGMPLVSDPGYRVVRACIAEGIDVRVIPGPSAVLAALVVSGLPADRFTFEGFPPRKSGERLRRLQELRDDPRTLVFYESPLRVRTLLRDMLVVFGDRPAAICRELTKLHEEVVRGRISDVLTAIGERPRGEIVVAIAGAPEPGAPDLEACAAEARGLVAGGMRKRDAARLVAERHGASANDVYRRLVGAPEEPAGA
jgi:16S rRNA (cytidine1402-2'-O)-methyltransferase